MKAEHLAHWYFRLNGFFTITNFVVHPSRKGSELTDGDILGVRFPHRAEFPQPPGADEAEFQRPCPYFLLAEVKRGRCGLNPSWAKKGNKTLSALLEDLGPFAAPDIPKVAVSLLCQGYWDRGSIYASLFFIGTNFDQGLPRAAPKRTWEQILTFVYERFQEYRSIKADHEQWDAMGQELWRRCKGARDSQAFVLDVKRVCDLPMTG